MNRYAMHTLMLVTLALLVSLVLMVSATKSEAAQKDYTGSMASRWPKLVACGAGALLIVTGIAWGVARLVTPQVVTFDMKGTMDIFIQQSAQQKLDEARAKALVSRFNQAMIDSLAAWQQKHNAVILVQPAVVSVQPDITPAIRNDIAARMQSPAGEVK